MLYTTFILQYDRIHAFIKADLWNSVHYTIVEGQAYEISNFVTTHPSGILRPVRAALKAFFTHSTTVHFIHENYDMVSLPTHSFDFVRLPQLATFPENYALDQTFAIGIYLFVGSDLIYMYNTLLCFQF